MGAETSSLAQKEPASFTRFNELPRELRLEIYKLAFPRRVLRFCEKWLPGHMGLVMEPLGPPSVAQTCHEAWEYSKTQYRRLTYHASKIRAVASDTRPITSPAPKITWFHPAVDVLCLNINWIDVACKNTGFGGWVRWHGIHLYNPSRDLQPAHEDLNEMAGRASYSEIVRALLPFAALAETVVVRPSLNRMHFVPHDFFPYADNSVFPKLKTVLITVKRLEWDNTGLLPPPDEPRPKWSVRLLDYYRPDLAHQVDVEFGTLDLDRSNRLVEESNEASEKGEKMWNAEPTQAETLEKDIEQEDFSKSDALKMWLLAAHYLRKEFKVQENGDRLYNDFYDWYWGGTIVDLERNIEDAKATVELPQFEPVAMVHKAPLI